MFTADFNNYAEMNIEDFDDPVIMERSSYDRLVENLENANVKAIRLERVYLEKLNELEVFKKLFVKLLRKHQSVKDELEDVRSRVE